jgi:hypothetical protein
MSSRLLAVGLVPNSSLVPPVDASRYFGDEILGATGQRASDSAEEPIARELGGPGAGEVGDGSLKVQPRVDR